MKHDVFGEAGDYYEPVRKLHPFVHELRKMRYDKGISQNCLALKMGYSLRTLKAWEAGETIPNLNAIEVWAQALGMDLQLRAMIEGGVK